MSDRPPPHPLNDTTDPAPSGGPPQPAASPTITNSVQHRPATIPDPAPDTTTARHTAADVAWARWNTTVLQRRAPEPTTDWAVRDVASTATPVPGPGGEADLVMVGFVLWLALCPLSPGLRRRYHLAVDRFRDWHTEQPHWLTSQPEPGPGHRDLGHHDLARHDLARHRPDIIHCPDLTHCQRRYLAVLRAAGHTDVIVVDAALEQLCRHLAHTSNPPRGRSPAGSTRADQTQAP